MTGILEKTSKSAEGILEHIERKFCNISEKQKVTSIYFLRQCLLKRDR